jgi:RimJ/RimL family protein N-acetyltransferase
MVTATLDVPVLETPRLILRGPRRNDFEALVSIFQDPVVMHYFHGPTLTREDVWSRLVRSYGMWAMSGYGMWAVEEKASGAYVGTVGAFESKREMTPPVENMPELGWLLAARFHGKGYATEAMQKGLRWLDTALNGPGMFCIVAPENKPSLRVAEKCGFVPWFETNYLGVPTQVCQRAPFGKITIA